MSARRRWSESLGSPLQQIAMGLVIVVLQAPFPPDASPSWQQYDALPNPLGWALVLSGTFALTRADPVFAPTRWLAGVAGLTSVPLWFPQVQHRLDDSGLWFSSLPQIAFCLWLSREIGLQGAQRDPPDDYAPKRFGLLVWGFGLLAVLPVLVLGGGFDQLLSTTEVVSWLVNVAFIYYLFRVHRREWLGGPGPLEIHPRRPGTHKSRPPSS
jgi:hypothetical protein